jgi:hypothetical protein
VSARDRDAGDQGFRPDVVVAAIGRSTASCHRFGVRAAKAASLVVALVSLIGIDELTGCHFACGESNNLRA